MGHVAQLQASRVKAIVQVKDGSCSRPGTTQALKERGATGSHAKPVDKSPLEDNNNT